MFNSVQYVRDLCKAKKVAVSQLEKECGFSNGYLNPKKMETIPYARAVTIAGYLGVPVKDILEGPETKNAPTRSDERKDVLDEVDVAFYGEYKELDEEQKATIRDMVAVMRSRKEKRPE